MWKYCIISLYILFPLLVVGQSNVDIYQEILKLNNITNVLYLAIDPSSVNTSLVRTIERRYKTNVSIVTLSKTNINRTKLSEEFIDLLNTNTWQYSNLSDKVINGYLKNNTNTLAQSAWLNEINNIFNTVGAQVVIVAEKEAYLRNPSDQLSVLPHLVNKYMEIDTIDFRELSSKAEKFMPKRIFVDYANRGNYFVSNLDKRYHVEQVQISLDGELKDINNYLRIIYGSKTLDNDLFTNIAKYWNDFSWGKDLSYTLTQWIGAFAPDDEVSNIKTVIEIRNMLSGLNEHNRIKNKKLKEIDRVIESLLHLELTLQSDKVGYVLGDSIYFKFIIDNPSQFPISISDLEIVGNKWLADSIIEIDSRSKWESSLLHIVVDQDFIYLNNETNLHEYFLLNLYPFSVDQILGKVLINIGGTSIDKKIIFNGLERGERTKINPEVVLGIDKKLLIFRDNTPKNVVVTVQSLVDSVSGFLSAYTSESWTISPEYTRSTIYRNKIDTFNISVSAAFLMELANLEAIFTTDTDIYTKKGKFVSNEIVPTSEDCSLVLNKIEFKTEKFKIAYIGDDHEEADLFRELGYNVIELIDDTLKTSNLVDIECIIIQKEFNNPEKLALNIEVLRQYAKLGGTLVIETPNNIHNQLINNILPYPIRLQNEWLPCFDCTITTPYTNHSVFKTPNHLKSYEFRNWPINLANNIPIDWDARYTPVLYVHNEGILNKSTVLITEFGKGKVIVSALNFSDFFINGTTGAYKFLINMIELK